ncbi:histidine phosphatase family protein [Parafrigoribacterium mesophilum]|uniref:histidine phosphatase family protein n=1 Tax=Parafrigoribacterium mesophilum TaxID=433646 RepID=UPI0031FDBE90
MSVSELVLVRHGQSTANVDAADAADASQASKPSSTRRSVRDPDVALTELGERQSAAVGRWLATLPAGAAPEAVWSSPYRRAAETTRIAMTAAGLSGPARLDERLRDREAGVTDGATGGEIQGLWSQESERRRRLGKFYYRPPGGESWADVALRVRFFLADLDRAGARRVLIVSHDTPIVVIRYACQGLSEAEVLALEKTSPLRNASVSRLIRTADGWSVAEYNTVAHLSGIDW